PPPAANRPGPPSRQDLPLRGADRPPGPERDPPLAVAVRADPADGAGVPVAVEVLVLVQDLRRDGGGGPAHRGGGMELCGEGEAGGAGRLGGEIGRAHV